jgi:hypothetical protein
MILNSWFELLLIFKDGIASYSKASYFKAKNQKNSEFKPFC